MGAVANGQMLVRSGATVIGQNVPAGDFVGPGASTDNHLVLFNGATGKLGKDTSPIVVAVGVVTGVTTINGADPGAHAARHNPAGADAMFPGTWAANDLPVWSGAAWAPKIHKPLVVAAAFTGAGTTPTDITGLTVAVTRAGSYAYDFTLHNTLSAQPRTIGFCVNASANFTSVAGVSELFSTATVFAYGTQTANNTAATVSKTVTTQTLCRISGVIVVSGACTLSCRAQSSAVTMTVLAGSGGYFMEI
jgi:hypothetical protein